METIPWFVPRLSRTRESCIGQRGLLVLCLLLACLFGERTAWAKGDAPVAVEQARVWLTVYRGGEKRLGGARVSRRGAWVDGVVEYRLDRPAKAGETLRLLDFAAFLREDPVHLEETTLAGYIDGPFDAGATVVTGSWGAKVRREGPRRDLILTLTPGTRVVTLRYSVDVPHRYWPFGCVWRRCSLSGAIAPLPSVRAKGGRWLPSDGRVVAPVSWQVVDARMAHPKGKPRAPSADDGTGKPPPPQELIVAGGHGEVTPYPVVAWGPKWHRERRFAHGVEIEVWHPRWRPSGRVPNETFVQQRRDAPGHALQIGAEMAELLAGAELPLPVGTKIVTIQGPLRSEVAQPHPSAVLLSDQALQLFPSKPVKKFHLGAIGRAYADVMLELLIRGRHDESTDLWLPGAMALALVQVWQAIRDHRDEFAGDILRNFTFVPAVDRFLYTQQASFSQAYFRGVEDAPALRNHPLWFSHELPTGRRIHEKLTDTLGPKKLGKFYDVLFDDPGVDPRRAAMDVYGYTLRWFFDQWLGPYPKVDYLIEGIDSTPKGGGWSHRIAVKRVGERPVIEPVQILVTERKQGRERCDGRDFDKDGEVDEGCHYLVWNGQLDPDATSLADEPSAGTHVFELETKEKIDNVRLDPRARLVQVPIDPTNVDPKFNDRRPAQFRFLYTGAGLSIAASEFVNANTPAARFNAIAGFIGFEASLRRDMRRTGTITVARDREAIVAVGSGANFWWGKKRNQRRRRGRVRLSAGSSLLSASSLDPRGGVRVNQRISILHDTRKFYFWPERGQLFSAGVESRQTIRIDEGPADHRIDLALSGGWVRQWALAHNHVIATLLSGEFVVPLVRPLEFRGLTRVGGIGGLSGYAADEVFGQALATAQAEYRHVFVSNLPINVLHIGYLRSIGGVLFAGTATTSACDSYEGWFGADSWYGHIGYGLTGRVAALGVTPQLIRIEASVPLVRRTGVRCLDKFLPDFLAERQGLDDPTQLLPPVNFNLLFAQPF